jgi:hypothetical protein
MDLALNNANYLVANALKQILLNVQHVLEDSFLMDKHVNQILLATQQLHALHAR